MSTNPPSSGTETSTRRRGVFHAAAFIAVLFIFCGAHTAFAASRTATVSGNWNSTATWNGQSVPGSADSVTINAGVIVTVPSGYAAQCTTINFTTNNGASAINLADATASLAASGAVTIQRNGSSTNTINVGAGTFSAASIALSATTGTSRLSQVLISTGTATVAGNITSSGTASKITFSGAGTLNAGGTFLSGSTGTFTADGGTVNFNGAGNQTISPYNFYNLTTSGSGTKTTSGAMTVGGALTVGAGTAFATGATNSWTLSVTGTTNVSGTLTLANTGNKTFSGDVILNSGSVWNATGAAAITLNGNLINDAATFTSNSGNYTFGGSGETLSGGTATAISGTAIFAGGNYANNGTFSAATLNALIAGASVTNNGTMTVSTALSGASGVFTQGTAGVLNFGGASIAIGTFSANAAGNTVNYTDAAQTVRAVAYHNLILSGTLSKSMTAGTSVAGNLSIAPTGTAKASIAAGQNLTVDTLTLGGVIRVNGTWGSTSSAATNKNDTYFAATTGILTVTNDTRITPTLSVTNSPVTYNGSGQAATVSASAPGTVSNILTGGASTQTNVGTYPVTADFTPNDPATYRSLTGASAGNFVINQASQTITFNALSNKSLGDADFVVSASASSGLTVSFTSQTPSVCTVSTATVHLVAMGTCTIRASQAGNSNYTAATPVDQSFSVSAGPAASFTLNNPGDMYAKTRLGYIVTRLDAQGNVTGTGTTTVYLYTSSTGGTQKFYNDSLAGSVITSIDIGPGHSTANVWYYDETPGTYTITASDSTPTADGPIGITDATDPVTVMPVATKFVILEPTNGTVDAPITVTVQAQKPDNSIDTNYQSDVTLRTTGSATGGGVVDIVNGTGHLSISDTHAETITLSLFDSQSTGLNVSSTYPLTFAAGALARFTLSHPAASLAGARAAYTVTRQDQHGNATLLATTTVYLYSSSTGANKKFYDAAADGAVITSVEIPEGQSTASFWYYDEKVGSWSITASESTPTPNGDTGVNDAVDTHQVTAAAAAAFFLNEPGNMTAGTRLGYTVTRKDQFSNLVTSGATTVHLSSDSTGTSTPLFYGADTGGDPLTSISISGGQSSAPFWYYDPNPGDWTVTASDSTPPDGPIGVADATDPVSVSAAPIHATQFVILPPTNGTVDAPVTITVRAEDASGNTDSTYQRDVTLNVDSAAVGLVDIMNGVGTLPVSSTVAHAVTLSLTDTQGTGLGTASTRSLTFAPGAIAQLTLNNPGDVAAGMRLSYTVGRKDQYGNDVTSGATTVNLSSSSNGANKKFYDAASGGSVITSIDIPDGSSSVGFWAYDEKAGSWLITVSASGVPNASDPLTIQPAAIAKFTLSEPGNMTAGTRLGYTVTRKDAFNNLVTTGVTLAYLYSSSTATTTLFYSADVGGAPTLFATINDNNASSDFWYYDETPGTWTITASDSSGTPNGPAGVLDATDSVVVSALPIVATRFVILPPASVQVGTPASVTVEAQDNAGNIDTTIQSGVTLRTTGAATGAGLVTMVNGVGTITLQDAVAETVTLSLSDTQSTHLNVSSTGSLTFSAVPVAPATAGGAGGAPTPNIAGVQISGRAFPGARIEILAVSPQGATIAGQATANTNGSFTALLTGLQAGAGTYGVLAFDALGRTTQTRVLYANYAGTNAFLSLDASLLSPTLGLVHPTVRRGDVVGLVGSALPGYLVGAQIDGKTVASATAADDGSYKILLPTTGLTLGSHTVRVRQVSSTGAQSEYAPQKVFTVTTLFTPQTDFNQDGIINVQDWSIFLSRWSSSVPSVHMLDDLNGDGKVDVTDLSIFVRTLKK